jgi:lipoate---protein ligase
MEHAPTSIQLLDQTFSEPAMNLALDEALLRKLDEDPSQRETLRIWEPERPIVVLGRSSQVDVEVNLDVCRKERISVLRRISGGATILTGPGCLMYTVILDLRKRPEIRMVDAAHCFVMSTFRDAFRKADLDVSIEGISDLALSTEDGLRKFSGNSVRLGRDAILYHGTLLYNYPLSEISRILGTPPRRPAYREDRSHDRFVANLPISGDTLRELVINAWDAIDVRSDSLDAAASALVAEKYSHDAWNLQGKMR